LGSRDTWISEFKASLVYRLNTRIARATGNPVPTNKGRMPYRLWFSEVMDLPTRASRQREQTSILHVIEIG
jgi:adenine-specific DNA glycosylase